MGRSPRAGRVAKGTSPRIGGKPTSKPDGTLRGKRRSSYGIKPTSKNKKMAAAQEQKMKKGILTEASWGLNGNDTIVRRGITDMSVASTVPDYGSFKQGNMLNSTEADAQLYDSHPDRPEQNVQDTDDTRVKVEI